MATRYYYNFARINPNTKMCVEVRTSTDDDSLTDPNCIPIPSYNDEYLMKYYINGSWWIDAAATQPFIPSF